MFPSNTGNVAKPCRMVLGSLIIQLRMGLTDRDLVDQISQNPYYQFFIGLPAFQHQAPFARTLLVEWRKRIDLDFVVKANNLLCDATPDTFLFSYNFSQDMTTFPGIREVVRKLGVTTF